MDFEGDEKEAPQVSKEQGDSGKAVENVESEREIVIKEGLSATPQEESQLPPVTPQITRHETTGEGKRTVNDKAKEVYGGLKANASNATNMLKHQFGKIDEKYKVAEKSFTFKRWICRTMVQRPLVHCGVYWGTMLLILIIIIAGGYLSLAQIALIDFQIPGELDVQRDFALTAGRDLAREDGSLITTLRFRNEKAPNFSIFFLYEAVDGANLLSPENVQAICETERAFFDNGQYNFFCITKNNTGEDTICDPQQVMVSPYFYNNSKECSKLSEAVIQRKYNELLEAPKSPASQVFNNLDDPTIARSIAFLGGPLGADSPENDADFTEIETVFVEPQAENGYKFFTEAYREAIVGFVEAPDTLFNQAFETKFFTPPGSVGLHLRTHGPQLEFLEFQSVVVIDSMISAGSFVVVTSLVWMYTGTLFFSFIAMMGVALSVVVGLFLYAVVFQIDYFNNLHVVVLFIVMAIGANNIFVLFDAWKQSEAVILEEMATDRINEHHETKGKSKDGHGSYNPMFEDEESAVDLNSEETLVRRLNYAYARAAQSVSNTALTTFIAFIATLSSPLAPIAAFGLFAGLVILVNLFYMLNIHPAALMVYHIHFVVPKERKKAKKENEEPTPIGKLYQNKKKKWIDMDKFFASYIYLVNKTEFPKVSLLGTVVYGITMFVFALQLETPTQVESNFGDDHMFSGFGDAFNEPFAEGNSDTFSQCTAVFGISGFDDTGIPRFTTDAFRGEPVFDDKFTILTETSQNFIKSVCDEIEVRPCDEEGCLESTLFLQGSSDCWIKIFQEYFFAETGSSESFVFREDGSETGLTEEDFIEHIRAFVEDIRGNGFKRDIGMFGGEIKFVTLRYRKSMKEDQPLKIKQPVINQIKEMTNEFREKAPIGMKTFYQTSFDFVWQHTEEGLVSGLYSGMAISLFACLFVVLIGTGNFMVSVFAIVGVGAIVFCVLGSVQTMGWELGTAEALAGVMVIGLAVDYTVHLGHMFVHSRHYLSHHDITDLKKESEMKTKHKSMVESKRLDLPLEKENHSNEERTVYNADMVHYAVDRMGVTILAGAFTTFCSGAFLLLCSLAFFAKMAILIIFTVIYSTIFAFCFFVPMLRIFGPGARGERSTAAAHQPGGAKKISV